MLEKLIEVISSCPAGAINFETMRRTPVSEMLNDKFIRTLAEHLIKEGVTIQHD